MKKRLCRGRSNGFIGAALALAVVSACSEDEGTTGCFEAGDADLVQPIDATPFGLTFGEWAEKWYEWNCGIPGDTNPTSDDTGEHCGVDQHDPDVWFLAGTSGGPKTRACDVPDGRAIFLPIITANCVLGDEGNNTDEDILACAKGYMDSVTELEADIDGEPVSNLFGLRAATSAFDVVVADNHPFCSPSSGEQRTAADGFWVMLQPLCNGDHTVHFVGKVGTFFSTEVTYDLTIGTE